MWCTSCGARKTTRTAPQSCPRCGASTEEHQPQEKAFVIVGWCMFAVALALMPFVFRLSWLIMIASIIMVGVDAFRNHLGVLERSKLELTRNERTSPVAWIVYACFLWFVFFPYYLVVRNRVVLAAQITLTHKLLLAPGEQVPAP